MGTVTQPKGITVKQDLTFTLPAFSNEENTVTLLTTLLTELLHTRNDLVSVVAHYIKPAEGKTQLVVTCQINAPAPAAQ